MKISILSPLPLSLPGTWEFILEIQQCNSWDLSVPEPSESSFYRQRVQKGMQCDSRVTSLLTQRVGLITPIFGCVNAVVLIYTAAAVYSFHSQWRETNTSREWEKSFLHHTRVFNKQSESASEGVPQRRGMPDDNCKLDAELSGSCVWWRKVTH